MKTGVFKSDPAKIHLVDENTSPLCDCVLWGNDRFFPMCNFAKLEAVNCKECKRVCADKDKPKPETPPEPEKEEEKEIVTEEKTQLAKKKTVRKGKKAKKSYRDYS